MASSVNVDHVLFSRAQWRLRLLIPCWVVQVVVLLCLMGIFAYRVAETLEHYEDEKQNGQIPMVEIVWESTNVGFSTLGLVCTVVEIAKSATERLTPFAMLCSYIIKLTLAFAMLSLDITVYVQNTDRAYSIVGLSLDCTFLAAAIATLIYSLVVFRRLLKYESYHETENAKDPLPGWTGRSGDDVEMMGNSVRISANPNAFRNDEEGEVHGITLKAEVDRHLSAEFGWAPPPGIDRSNTIVNQGIVSSGKASPAHVDLGRTRSYATEPAVMSDGHEPESDDEGARQLRVSDEVDRRGRDLHDGIPVVVVPTHDDGIEEDRRALLGGH